MKLSSSNSSHKNVIHVSLSLREDVKLNQTKDAWRPARFKKDNLTEEEFKTQVISRLHIYINILNCLKVNLKDIKLNLFYRTYIKNSVVY